MLEFPYTALGMGHRAGRGSQGSLPEGGDGQLIVLFCVCVCVCVWREHLRATLSAAS